MDFNISFKNFYEGADSLLHKIGIQKNVASKNKKPDSDVVKPSVSTKGKVERRTETRPTATAIFDFNATEEDMISFMKHDKIVDVETNTGGWWRGSCHGVFGRFPSNHVILDFISY